MHFPTSRREFRERKRLANYQRWLWTAISLVPAVAYFGPLMYLKRPPIAGLSESMEVVLMISILAWMVGAFAYFEKVVLKNAGLRCDECNHTFAPSAFELAMATGRCGGCGAKVLLDEP